MIIENEHYRIGVDEGTGVLSSLVVKRLDCDLVSEKRPSAVKEPTMSNELESRRQLLERAVRTYFEACNEANREKFYSVLAEDVIHYFPPQVGGPYRGRQAVVNLWLTFVREKDSRWTIDRLVTDGREVAIEWTHFKPKVGEHIRGAEWYEFDEAGRITEIRAYYASPRDPNAKANELEGFPYAEKGFLLEPPQVNR